MVTNKNFSEKKTFLDKIKSIDYILVLVIFKIEPRGNFGTV